MPLGLQQLETIQAACSDTIYDLLEKRLEEPLKAVTTPLESKFTFEDAVAILKRKPKLFERLDLSVRYAAADAHGRMKEENGREESIGESKEKPSHWSMLRTEYNQLANDWRALAKCIKEKLPVPPDLQYRLSRAIPNFNPRYIAYIDAYEEQLTAEIAGADALTSITSLVRLRESCLGMTPLTTVTGEGYTHLLHRLGRVPYNLDKQGSTANQEEITAVICMYIEMRVTDAHIAQERKSTAAETIRKKDTEIAELTKLLKEKHLLTEGLIEEVKERNPELKNVRPILAEAREGKSDEKRRGITPATPLLPVKEEETRTCYKVAAYVGSILQVAAVAETIVLAVILTKKKDAGGDCVEPVYPITYSISYGYSNAENIFFDFSLTSHILYTDTIYEGVQFVNGVNISKIYLPASWGPPQTNITFESTPLPGIGFLHKVIFTEGWSVKGGVGSVYLRCNYDLATSIGPWAGMVHFFPLKNYPVQAYVRAGDKVSVPINGLSTTCVQNPVHAYTHGAYVGHPPRGWYSGGVTKLPPSFTKLTTLFYDLLGAQSDGSLYPSIRDYDVQAYLNNLAEFRLQYPLLNQEVYLLLGGPCSFGLFSEIIANPVIFAKLQQNLLKAMASFDAEGLVWDLQWGANCPGSFNETSYIQLHEKMAAMLRPFGKKLHSAFPASNLLSNTTLCKVGKIIDKAHLKTYEYANFLGGISGDAAGLNQVVASVQNYLDIQDAGTFCLSPKQVLIGAPSFGQGVAVSNIAINYGYGQPITGWMPGEFYGAPGLWTYKCITKRDCISWAPPFSLTILPPSQSPSGQYSAEAWAYKKQGNNTGTVLSFDTPYSVCRKIQYAKAEGSFAGRKPLGGYFLLYSSGDSKDSDLLGAADIAFSTKDPTCSDSSTIESTSVPDSKKEPLLPSAIITAMAQAASDGLFYGFLYELHRRGLTDLLKPQGYSSQQIHSIEKVLQTIYHFGTWGCAAPGLSFLLVRLGLPREAVDKVIGNTALATGLWFSFWPTMGCMAGSTAGAWVAAPAYHRVIKPAAMALDASAAAAVAQWGKPLATMAGTLAGAAAHAVRDIANNGAKTRVGAAVGATASMASGVATQAAQRYRRSWLGSAVGSLTAPIGALSDAVLHTVSNTRLGTAVSSATNAAKAGFWAKATSPPEMRETLVTPVSNEHAGTTERITNEVV